MASPVASANFCRQAAAFVVPTTTKSSVAFCSKFSRSSAKLSTTASRQFSSILSRSPASTTSARISAKISATTRLTSSSSAQEQKQEQKQQPAATTINGAKNDRYNMNDNAKFTIHFEKPLDPTPPPDRLSIAAKRNLSIADTSMGSGTGAALLDGLDVYTVPALDDHHPLAVYGLDSLNMTEEHTNGRVPILLLHGRTWSSVPVYHLLGGDVSKNPLVQKDKQSSTADGEDDVHESRSLMEALLATGLQPYAMDFRGFGGTPQDETGYVEPHRCVHDVETVLLWIAQRHGKTLIPPVTQDGGRPTIALDNNNNNNKNIEMPALLGWSQGALVAQLVAQLNPSVLSKLVLYGSIYDPLVRYPREPLYRINEPNASQIPNTFNDAIEDFTVQGTIPPEPARLFAEAALVSDPIKAVWKHLYQFNNCDPARVHVPTLVVAGDQDPYAPLHVQQELFCNLGRGSDRTWSILADADHAAHLLNEARDRFVNITTSFVMNGKRGEPWVRRK